MSDQWVRDPTLKVNCVDCTAECCKHIAVPLDDPKDMDDFDDIKWYLAHENVSVFKDDEGWYVEFKTRCKNLDGNKCKVHNTKDYPRICREYDAKTCTMNELEPYYDILFETWEDVDRYCAEHDIKRPEPTLKESLRLTEY